MNDLIAQAAAADFESRAVMPVRELGAYEVFWAQALIAEAIPATTPIIRLFVAHRILRNPFDDFENLG